MRTGNLIQSYINNNSTVRQYNSDKAAKEFDIHKELTSRTFIKPLPSNGKLLKPSLFDMPSEVAKDLKYDAKALVKGIKGDANDHQLGRLNDIGMKLGGLAIAAYLFTKKQTPKAKIFEFVGLATFFGAMNVWPKLFIQLPAWLIHGVNVRQKYEDNYGRKKMFYQDHQFIPWDLYSDKDINKIGDRLNVPKDIPNRREFIQEKMRKIALQNNTMWMLTAGFATPLLSALMCNVLEKPIQKYQEQKLDAKANALLTHFNEETEKYDFTAKQKALSELLSGYKGKAITPEMVNEIQASLTTGMDHMIAEGVRADLNLLLPTNQSFKISENTVSQLRTMLAEHFSSVPMSEAQLSTLLPDERAILKALSDRNLLNSEVKEFSEYSKVIQNLLEENITQVLKGNTDKKLARQLNFAMDTLRHESSNGLSPLDAVFRTQSAGVLTDGMITTIESVGKMIDTLKAKTNVFDRFSFMKAAQAEETILADVWNEISESLFDTLKFTPDEIKDGRLDRELAGQIFREKIEALAADKEAFGAFIEKFEKMLSNLSAKTESMAVEKDSNAYRNLVETVFGEASTSCRDIGFLNTEKALMGIDDYHVTGAKEVFLRAISDRIKGVKSSFYRIQELANLFYKTAHVESVSDILTPDILRMGKEERVDLARKLLLEGRTSDFAVKFTSYKRNPFPDRYDRSQIESVNGRFSPKYLGVIDKERLVELPNDRHFFSDVMKLMFGGEIHPDILSKIKDAVFFKDYLEYRDNALKILGGEEYFPNKSLYVDGIGQYASTANDRFNRCGCAVDDMMQKLFSNKFNSKKWFSVFGKLGAALIGVTILSQFFIGRMKAPVQTKEAK